MGGQVSGFDMLAKGLHAWGLAYGIWEANPRLQLAKVWWCYVMVLESVSGRAVV